MAVAFVTVVMADLSLGLCMYALLAFLNIVPDAGGSFISFDKVAGGLLAISWLAAVAARRDARRAFFTAHPQFSAGPLFFLPLGPPRHNPVPPVRAPPPPRPPPRPHPLPFPVLFPPGRPP